MSSTTVSRLARLPGRSAVTVEGGAAASTDAGLPIETGGQ
jgi:hypothetical protein